MDALWKIEDKLKISTQKAIVLLICTTILVIIVCAIIIVLVLKNKASKRNKIACHDYYSSNSDSESESESMILRSAPTRSALLGSPCWSVAHKWSEESGCLVVGNYCKWKIWKLGRNNDKMIRLNNCGCCCMGRASKLEPVWQRPILMGVKCKLPRFSGLILYDERGRPLPNHHHHHHHRHNHQFSTLSSTYEGQEEMTTPTMLMDLL